MKELKVMDEKSGQNILILLNGSLKHMSHTDVRRCILRCDETVLTENVLQQLITYLPPADQLNKLKEYKHKYDELTDAEQFAITVRHLNYDNFIFGNFCQFNAFRYLILKDYIRG